MRISLSRKSEIQELLRAGRHVEAEQQLRAVCAGPEADAESWFFLGALSGARKDAAGAENFFRKALALNPDFLQARFNLGIALRDQDRLDDARAELEAVVASQPGHAEACNALGYVYVRLERQDDAERLFRAALARNPAYLDALTNLGNVLSSRKRWAEAVALYRRALDIAPAHSDAAINLGGAFAMQGRVEEAITAYRQAIAANPANAAAYVQLGIAFKRLGKTQEAELAFREALRISPDHAEAQYFLATLGGDVDPETAPTEYVTRLFDDYAETFDAELVEKLQYRTPEALLGAVQAALAERRDLDVLDLGCGTGLCGPLFKPLSRTLAGVDLSPKMIAKARIRDVYDELEVGEVTAALLRREAALDLAIAADVFVYIGELMPVFAAAAKALRPRGLFAFSVEVAKAEEGEGYALRSTGRYAHAKAYLAGLMHRCGFAPVSCEELCIRMDNGQPITGAIHILRHSA
jgi:predicted TPR repeat methyltransferase